MFCGNCKHDCDDDANYCRICGAAFDENVLTASDSPDVEWGEHVFLPRNGWIIVFMLFVLFIFGLMAMAVVR